MHILHDANRPFNVNSLTEPLAITHYWAFSGQMLDFKLEPLEYIEETTGPTITVEANGFQFDIPVSWTLLAVERETYSVDTVPVMACATFEHELFLFNLNDQKLNTLTVKVVDFKERGVCYHPMIPKGMGMVIPIAKSEHNNQQSYYGIIASPYDLHRYIGGSSVGDILG